MLPSEILDNAANIILRDGWWQGTYYKEVDYDEAISAAPEGESESAALRKASEVAEKTAPCCQEGAINRAACGYAWLSSERRLTTPREDVKARDEAVRWMRQYLNATESLDGAEVRSAVSWNDHPDTTAEKVVAALRAAAELARNGGEYAEWRSPEDMAMIW